MLQTISEQFLRLQLYFAIVVTTQLLMPFVQTLLHYKLGHHPVGVKFIRNQTSFHHIYTDANCDRC